MPSRKSTKLASHIDPHDSARAAGLRYTTDHKPGIQRIRHGKTFRYLGPDNTPIQDEETLHRIHSLVIPPAWEQVWICPIPNGHLQVTGRDVRGRKQSRYHPLWRQVRDETKYERMKMFATVLPSIRRHVDHDLRLPGLPRRKVLATIISVMQSTFIRVGNAEYARDNQSYGLTTMQNKHVDIHGNHVTFSFHGKSGVAHTIDLHDKRLAHIIHRCHDIPGHDLFQFVDHEGTPHHLDSTDVNEYLREITNEHFTAKDFRTWAGTVLACMMLQQLEPVNSGTQAKKNIVATIAAVAQRLGNTPSVCRKCYVHPAVLEHYLHGTMATLTPLQIAEATGTEPHALRQEELNLLHLLDQQLK